MTLNKYIQCYKILYIVEMCIASRPPAVLLVVLVGLAVFIGSKLVKPGKWRVMWQIAISLFI